jgi:hypothetical protein
LRKKKNNNFFKIINRMKYVCINLCVYDDNYGFMTHINSHTIVTTHVEREVFSIFFCKNKFFFIDFTSIPSYWLSIKKKYC